MSVDAGTIYSEVRIQLDKLSGDIQSVRTQFDQLGAQTKQQADHVGNTWGLSFNAMKVAAVAAFGAVTLFLKGAVQEFLKAEESSTKLGSALRATGEGSNYTRARMEDYATALMGVTKFEHEATQNAMSLMMTVGGMTSKMAEDAIPAVMDLASALGIDLEQAAMLVSKAVEGNVGALGRYGIKVDASGSATERLAQVTQALEDRFGGLALAIGDTASGKLVQLGNAFSDVKEEIGRTTTNAIVPFVAWLTEVTKGIGASMKATNDLKDALAAQSKGYADTNDKLTIAAARYADAEAALAKYEKEVYNIGAYLGKLTQEQKDHEQALKDQVTTTRLAMRGVEDLARREQAAADARAAAEKKAKEAAEARAEALKKQLAAGQDLMTQAEEDAKKQADLTAQEAEGENERRELIIEGQRAATRAKQDYLDGIADEIQANSDLMAKEAEARDKANRSALQTAQHYQDKLQELGADELQLIEIERQRAIAAVKASGASEEEMAVAIVSISTFYDKLRDETAAKKFRQSLKETVNTIADYFDRLLTAVVALSNAQADAQIADVDRVQAATVAALDAQLAAALVAAGVAEESESQRLQRQLAEAIATGDAINIKKAQDELTRFNIEQDFSEKKTKAEKEAERKKARIQYEADHYAWQVSLAAAFADAARAIINIWSAWAWNPIAAGIMTGLTAAITGLQVDAIYSAEPKPPAMQYGGIVLPGSYGSGRLVRVAENGAPELMLNGGDEGRQFLRAFAREIAGEMRGASNTVTSVLVVDGKKMAEVTARYFNKGITRLNR